MNMGEVVIKLSNVLAGEVGGNRVNVEASTLKQALDGLVSGRDGLREKLLDESGKPRDYINIYVDGRDYRFLSGLDTPLKSGSSVQIIPAVSGG
jgi:molybdopterin converting factor small subunit